MSYTATVTTPHAPQARQIDGLASVVEALDVASMTLQRDPQAGIVVTDGDQRIVAIVGRRAVRDQVAKVAAGVTG